MHNKRDLAQTIIGTPHYSAPEIDSCKIYDTKADIWNLGLILYELLTTKSIFLNEPNLSLIDDPYLKMIVGSMLSKDPSKRPTIDEVIHEFTLPEELLKMSGLLLKKSINTLIKSSKAIGDFFIKTPFSHHKK